MSEQKKVMHVALSGPIGAGKTTLLEPLAKALESNTNEEPYQLNPFLEKFYDDHKRWALHAQLQFWLLRIQAAEKLESKKPIVSERCTWEDWVFAKVQHNSGDMDDDEWKLYEDLFNTYMDLAPKSCHPDAIVFLDTGVKQQMARIKKRSREMESSIGKDYLKSFGQVYDAWCQNYASKVPVFIIDWNKDRDDAELEKAAAIIAEKVKETTSPGIVRIEIP